MNIPRRNALFLLGSTVLSACATTPLVTKDEYDPFEGGIGGTGIVGTLNGFGSLLINGLRVDLGRSTRVNTAFGRASTEMLAAGQVLTVAATRRSDAITAQNVTIDYALVGRLHQIGSAAAVNGVPLLGWQDVIVHEGPGRRVAVSGVWTPDGVRPSRIDPAPHDLDLIAGTMDRRTIGGVPLTAHSRFPTDGSYAVAIGRAEDQTFSVEQFGSGRFAQTDGLSQLSVEGYLEPAATAPGFRVAGLGHSFAPDTALSAIGARRAIYIGPYNGLFSARRGYVVPDLFEARRNQLRTGLGPGFGGPIEQL